MAKKKKQQQQKSKDANPGTSTGSGSTASDELDSVPAPAAATSDASAAPAAAKGPVDFDAAARDQFADSFKPAWQVAQENAARPKAAQEALRSEHALSGEISLDSIPLPPLPTDKPKRQVIVVLVVILLIVIAGIVVSQNSRNAETPAPSGSTSAEP